MFIVVNGFIPIGNDILGKGGRCVKVACVPIGEYRNATKDSYSAEYDEEGNQTYLKKREYDACKRATILAKYDTGWFI